MPIAQGEKVMAWKDSYYVKCHRLAHDGLTDEQIANALGVTRGIFKAWLRTKKALRQALSTAREKGGTEGFKKWAESRMPRKARELWNYLEMAEDVPKSDKEGIREARAKAIKLIDMGSTRVKQHVFLQALVKGNFMPSVASRLTGIAVEDFRRWLQEDRSFAQVYRSLQEAKKDFYESALIDLVRTGDSAATIFANKTINRDRGYDTSTKTLNITGMVDHKHSLSPDEIPLEAKRMMLQAIRDKKDRQMIEDKSSPIVDAEIVES